MKYLLMFWDQDTTECTADEEAAMPVLRSWVEDMTEQGIRLHGSSLQPASHARLVRVRDGDRLVSDGPFAETKEQIAGYDVIECADLDLAVEVAAAHPLAKTATVEVRPLADFPWYR